MAERAGRQHGIVSREQLRRLGLGDDSIDYALATGRLHRVFPRAFSVGRAASGASARLQAALLTCGEGSVVSHGSAAAALGLWERPPGRIELIAPAQAGRKIDGIRPHFVPRPRGREAIEVDGLACTSPARTIVDLAGFLPESRLRKTIERAAVNRMLSTRAIEAVLSGPRRRGSRRLRRILGEWGEHDEDVTLRSPLEARLLSLIGGSGLPTPECNARLVLEGRQLEVDFLWPAQRLVLEADGARFHDNPVAQARDAERDRLLRSCGYEVIRLRWSDVERPAASVAKLRRRLRERSAVP